MTYENSDFCPCQRVQARSGSHPASYPANTRVLCLEVQRPQREADRLPSCNAEFKNAWGCTFTPSFVILECYWNTGTTLFFRIFQICVIVQDLKVVYLTALVYFPQPSCRYEGRDRAVSKGTPRCGSYFLGFSVCNNWFGLRHIC
jgi:hypothetical protein